MKYTIVFSLLLLLAACSTAPASTSSETVITIGAIMPLSEAAASIGLPLQRITQEAVADLNEQWAEKNMRLEVIYEDGRCSAKNALTVAQKLVNFDGVSVIYGGLCSSETLGIAALAEAQKIIVFSPTSSSPEVSRAGDFVFRNYPSDTAQVAKGSEFISAQGFMKVAILSENTDYAQALRQGYVEFLAENGIELVADQIVNSESRDVRTELIKIKNAEPELLIMIAQSIPAGVIYYQQLYEASLDVALLTNEVSGLPETLEQLTIEANGAVFPESYFAKEQDPIMQALLEKTDCNLGVYCATTYDGIMLLGDLMESCFDDPICLRDALYATQNWEGQFSDSISFDTNGDVGGTFVLKKVVDGMPVLYE